MKRTHKTTFAFKTYLYNAHIFENLHSLFNCMGVLFRCGISKRTEIVPFEGVEHRRKPAALSSASASFIVRWAASLRSWVTMSSEYTYNSLKKILPQVSLYPMLWYHCDNYNKSTLYRRVARVLLKWKHFQAGGLGATLRPQGGPGRSPGGGPGGEAPGSYWI